MRIHTIKHEGRIVSRRWYIKRIGEPPAPKTRTSTSRYPYAVLTRSRFHSIHRLRLVNMTIPNERDWMELRLQQRHLTIFPLHP